MTRLIEANALRKDIVELPNCSNGFSDTYDKAMILGLIDEQPTVLEFDGEITKVVVRGVEYKAVRHGRWTADESTYTDGEAQCSVCKTTFYVDDLYCVGEKAQSELPNYCPHCGAKMTDGEE